MDERWRPVSLRNQAASTAGWRARSMKSLPTAPNLLEQRFDAIVQPPGRVWLTDITYIPTDEGWVYLAAVKDACNRKIVGWSAQQHMRAELVIQAMQMAIAQKRPQPRLIAHIDRLNPPSIRPLHNW